MENYIIVSKVKKFIKEKQGFNTSANFFEPLNQDVMNSINSAIEHAKRMNRKTVMGRDFNFFNEAVKPDASLVVASKVKKYIKENANMNTSAQVIEQLSIKVESICLSAIKNAVDNKRKTVMDKDYSSAQADV